MRVLILMHDVQEDAGTIARYLQKRRAALRVVRFYDGESLPDDASQVDAVVSMGGPMNVDEEEAYPFLREERLFLSRCFERQVPVLGICLGAQMIAKAAGGRVMKAPQEEVGWYTVSLTEEGSEDPFFLGLPDSFLVFQLHGDTFDLPPGGTLLVTSPTCRNQAFRLKNSLALQFHLEINADKLALWLAEHHLKDGVLKVYDEVKDNLYLNVQRLCRNFFGQVEN